MRFTGGLRWPGIALVMLLVLPHGVHGQTPADRGWRALDARIEQLYNAGQMAEALAAAHDALAAASGPGERGRSLGRLGFLLFINGKLKEAEEYLRESLQVREAAFGIDSLQYAETANDLALLFRDLGRMAEARTLAEQASATRRRSVPAADILNLQSLDTLGTVYSQSGDYVAALTPFEEAVRIHEAIAPAVREQGHYGVVCINLAVTYQRLGKYDGAMAAFAKGLEALRGFRSHPALAVALIGYAALRVELGSFAEAEALYEEGERVFLEQLDTEHQNYAIFLNNRGFMYQSIGNFELAERDYVRSIELKKKVFGPDSLTLVASLRNLARLVAARDPAAGEQLLIEAARIVGRAGTPPPLDQVGVLVALGRAQQQRHAFVEAAASIEQALSVARSSLGASHPMYASALRERALINQAEGHAAEAGQQLQEALTIAERAYGSRHPELVAYLTPLAQFHQARGDLATAVPLYRRGFEIDDRFLSDVLSIGSESFKRTSLANRTDLVPVLIALQDQPGADGTGAGALAFEAVLRRKGRILEQVRGWRDRLRDSAAEPVRNVVSEWDAVVRCRTSLTVALGYREIKPGIAGACGLAHTDFEGRYERLLSDLRARWTEPLAKAAVDAVSVLTERGDRLEATLVRMLGPSGVTPDGLTAADLTARLKPGEVLIEYVSYLDQAQPAATARQYGAFVLDPRGHLAWSRLGPARPIDAAVDDLLNAANDWSVSTGNRESRAARASELTADRALAEIARRVWAPIAPILEALPDARLLRIAPDAALNLVPFEALPAEGRLIDRFSVAYLPAGRDLGRAAGEVSRRPAAIVVSPGGPLRAAATPTAAANTFRGQSLVRLVDAQPEAVHLRRLLPHAELFASRQASERAVKTLQAPVILHIIGHGLVRSDDRCGQEPCPAAGSDLQGRAMTRSAIVLEEAYGRDPGSSEDGILTPAELQGMDLRGTEMVVLSQCRMASGLASAGEGIYGMRRAAAVAGASSFVAPLWNVADRVQSVLMQHFYRDLVAGRTRADALRQAKLAVRRNPSTSSFLFWAPVILSGDSSRLWLGAREVAPADR